LERLLALLPAEGEPDRELVERVEALPDSTFRPAARALYELGWLRV
jgi:hypothetical protein